MEPAPSESSAAGTNPAATAAVEPSGEPPGVRSAAHGLWVWPKAAALVNGSWPSSQVLVLPTITAPAARSRRTDSASSVFGGKVPPQPKAVGSPAISVSSFTATGTPSSGSRSPAASRASAASASSGARVS